MSKKRTPDDVSIGKLDIPATYTYARWLLDGLHEDEAKERGMVEAIMGAKARLGHGSGTLHDDYLADKQAAEKRPRSPHNPSTSRSLARWASSSTRCSCRR